MKHIEPKEILACQMSKIDKKAFKEKAAQYGGTSHVLRELVKGFTQGRVSIKPPLEKHSLYTQAEQV